MRKNILLIVLFAIVTIIISYTSCTYDYFEDETNYIVFVPEVYDKTVRDCRVMIYNEAGVLVGEKSATAPFDKDPRIQIGQFAFRLQQPGDYKVYCYTNTDSLTFAETGSFDRASFKMNLIEGSDNYMQPSDMYFQKLEHTVEHPAFLIVDTTDIKRYTGRITVRYKNFPAYLADLSKVEKIHTTAEGIGTKQYIKLDTLTTRSGPTDVMSHFSTPLDRGADRIEIDNRFFPSIEDTLSVLNFELFDSNDERVINLSLEVADFDTQIPLRLLHGRRMIIEVDRYTIINVSVVDWDADVQEEDVNME